MLSQRDQKNCVKLLVMGLVMASIGTHAQANTIKICNTSNPTAGTVTSCTFNHNTSNFTGILNISETFTSNTGGVGVALYLTNTIAGDNVNGIFDYTVTKTIFNNTGSAWAGFSVSFPDASAQSSTASVIGFSSCSAVVKGYLCSGGTVADQASLTLQFHISTPLDQQAGAFGITQAATVAGVPEPATFGLIGASLIALGIGRVRRTRAA